MTSNAPSLLKAMILLFFLSGIAGSALTLPSPLSGDFGRTPAYPCGVPPHCGPAIPPDSGHHYRVSRTVTPPVIDGKPDDPAWEKAPWTSDFTDIEGALKPPPPLKTRAKLLWDDHYLYIAAELEEPHLWATYDADESVIFHENDFEIFIDPGNDGLLYYELEINALGTKWDLLLTRPYREGGFPINAWEITGLIRGVYLDGSLNDPSDLDRSWSLELALPWKVLRECAPHHRRPVPGDTWRLNFSRVQWDRETIGGKYVKKADPLTGKPLPEHNWVWAPQGVINMHIPEKWGMMEFME